MVGGRRTKVSKTRTPTLLASGLIGGNRPVSSVRVERSPICLENQARAWEVGGFYGRWLKAFKNPHF